MEELSKLCMIEKKQDILRKNLHSLMDLQTSNILVAEDQNDVYNNILYLVDNLYVSIEDFNV